MLLPEEKRKKKHEKEKRSIRGRTIWLLRGRLEDFLLARTFFPLANKEDTFSVKKQYIFLFLAKSSNTPSQVKSFASKQRNYRKMFFLLVFSTAHIVEKSKSTAILNRDMYKDMRLWRLLSIEFYLR